MKTNHANADDIVRVKQSTLINLNHDAKKLSLKITTANVQQNGSHLTKFKGLGMEFDEVRPYQAGDNLYSIDWRVTARTGKPHTKMFREERERPVLLWVDYRQTMFFGTRVSFKSVLAAKIAALLTWSTVQHGDRIGGLIFSEQQHDEIRPLRGKKGALQFIHKLSEHSAWDNDKNDNSLSNKKSNTSTCIALQRLHHVTRPGSLIFLISDFYYFDEAAQHNLAAISRRNDVVLISIYDPMEKQLPTSGQYRFSNGNAEININTNDQKTCEYFRQHFQQRQQQLKNVCLQLGLHHLNMSTNSEPINYFRSNLSFTK